MSPLLQRQRRALRGWPALTCSALAVLLIGSRELEPRSASAHTRLEADKQLSEYEIKAQVLARIVKYTRWPDTAFESREAPFVIAVLEKDPFGETLEETFKDAKVGDRRVKLVRGADIASLGSMQLVFVSGKDETQLQKLIEQFAGKPVLIVADTLRGAELGAHVGFYLEAKKLRFAIHTGSAKKSGLEMSSELLKLAKIISTALTDGDKHR
jgi:hypothetical protein